MNGNTIVLRHSRKGGNGNFADGHTAVIPWQWSTNDFYFNSANRGRPAADAAPKVVPATGVRTA